MSARLRDLFPNAAAASAVWECAVAGISPDSAGLTVQLQSSRPVPSDQLEEARVAICRAYGVAGVQLLLEAPEEQPSGAAEALEASHPQEPTVPMDDAETLREQFSVRYPSAAPCLRAAAFALSDNRLVLQVSEAWHATRLEQLKAELERDAAALLGHPVRLEITAPSAQQDYEQARAARAAQLSRDWQPPVKSAPPPPPQDKPQRRGFQPKRDPNAPVFRPKEDDTVIFGKPTTRELVKLGEVNMDTGRITAQGEIFLVEFKKLNGKDKTVVKFEFSDGTGSIRATKVLDDETASVLEGDIKAGAYVIVQGQVH